MLPAGALGALPALAAALILSTDRKIVRGLRSAQATDAAHAVPFAPPGPLGRSRLRRLLGVGAVVEIGGRYHLSEPGYAAWRTVRRKRGVTIMAVMAAVIGVMAAFGIIRF